MFNMVKFHIVWAFKWLEFRDCLLSVFMSFNVVCGSLISEPCRTRIVPLLAAINAHYRLSNKLDIRLLVNGVLLFYEGGGGGGRGGTISNSLKKVD